MSAEAVRRLHKPVDIEPSGTICGECSFQLPNGRYFGKVVEYERVTFDTEEKARRYLRDNAEHVAGLNEQASGNDRVVASIEKRRVYESGDWLPVPDTTNHEIRRQSND